MDQTQRHLVSQQLVAVAAVTILPDQLTLADLVDQVAVVVLTVLPSLAVLELRGKEH
jgi:hypothetical protein